MKIEFRVYGFFNNIKSLWRSASTYEEAEKFIHDEGYAANYFTIEKVFIKI